MKFIWEFLDLIRLYLTYKPIPLEAIQLAMKIQDECLKENPDKLSIYKSAQALERLLRSARKL